MSRKFSTPSGGTRWISIVLLLATAVIGLTNGITPLTLSFSATADEAISGKSEAAFGPQVPERPLKVCVCGPSWHLPERKWRSFATHLGSSLRRSFAHRENR